MTAFNKASRYVCVLDQGLPSLPARVTPGEPLPIAVWTGPRYGAVTVIEDCEHHPYCQDEEHCTAMTYAYHRGSDGWELPQGAGGVDWPDGPCTNASLDDREVRLEGGRSAPSRGWDCCQVEGFAGAAARWVELRESGSTTKRPLSPSGAFVVVLNGGGGPATVTVLDEDEAALGTYEFRGEPRGTSSR